MANDLWRTPKQVFNHYNKLYFFECDVAADHDNHLCEKFITERENALEMNWCVFAGPGEYVWCNPPYSDPLPWVEHCIFNSRAYGVGSVMLLNHDMSVEWSFVLSQLQCEIHVFTAFGRKFNKTFKRGRMSFLNANNEPVDQNNKGQFVAVIPPYVRPGKPQTEYIPLNSIMEAA